MQTAPLFLREGQRGEFFNKKRFTHWVKILFSRNINIFKELTYLF